jgi:hypothetical protein
MSTFSIFSKLPKYIIVIIIGYNDDISYRSGKYINRIKKDDDRCNLLMTIPKKIYDIYEMNYYVYLQIDGDKDKYLLMESETHDNNYYIYLTKYNWHESTIYVVNEGDLDGYNITNEVGYQMV